MITPARPRDTWSTRSALLAVQLLFGIHYLVAKWIVSELEPAAWACLRVFSSLIVLAAILAASAILAAARNANHGGDNGGTRRRPRLPSLRDTLYLGFCSIFGVILNQSLFLEGISRTTVGHAALINSQIPVFALLVALLLRHERWSLRTGLSFLAGMAGVLVLLEVDRFTPENQYLTGDLLNLANAFSYGLFIVISRPVIQRNDPLAATTVIFAFGSVGLLLYGGNELAAARLDLLSTRVVAGMVFAVLGATVLTYYLNYWALKRTHATRVALYIFLQPVVAALLGIWLLDDAITARFLMATALVFVALLLRDLPGRGR